MRAPEKPSAGSVTHAVILFVTGIIFLFYPVLAYWFDISAYSPPLIRVAMGLLLVLGAGASRVVPFVRHRIVALSETLGALYTGFLIYLLWSSGFSVLYFGFLLCAIASVSYMARDVSFYLAYAVGTTVATTILALHMLAPGIAIPGEWEPSFMVFFVPFLVVILQAMGLLSLWERNKGRRALEEQTREYEAVVRDQTEFICRYRESGEILFVNRAFAEFISGDSKELVGSNVLASLPPEAETSIREQIARAEVGDTFDWDGEIQVGSRGNRAIHWTNRIVSRDRRGSVIQAVGRDVTLEREGSTDRGRLIAAIEDSPLGIGIADEYSNLIFANKSMQSMFGYSAEEINEIGGPAALALNPQELAPVSAAFEEGHGYSGPMSFRARDGSTLRHYVQMVPIYIDGIFRGVVSTHTDASEQQKILGALRESEERFRQVAEHIREAVVLHSQDEVLYVNPAFETLFERDRQSIYLGFDSYEQWVHPEDRPWYGSIMGDPIRDNGKSIDLTYRIVTPTEESKWVRHRSYPIKNLEGKATRAVTVISDITEAKEMEHRLTLFKRGIEQTQDPVVMTDGRGQVIFVNHAMEELTGYKLEELQNGIQLSSLYTDPDRLQEDSRRLVREGHTVSEHRLRDRRGREHAVRIRGDSILDAQGVTIGAILIHADLDKVKRYEAQLIRAKQRAEEANRAKSVFLANMSHEIRTPINGMLGLLRLLPDADPETQRSYHRLIEDASSSLVQLIDDILDLSRIEADRLTLMPQAFALGDLLQHISSFFAADVERKGISLSVDIAEETPKTIVTDRVRLQQVLTNLIGNAVKYTEEGFVRVRAYPVSHGEDSSVEVGFSVQDSGIGISEENQAKLFGYFQQLEEGYAKKYGGAGVGLAVSKRLVELMGGNITVESAPGVGSTFSFTVDAVMERRSEPREKDMQMHLELRQGLRILLAEDNEINLLAMKAQLERGGHQVTVARDGVEALERYEEGEFDVALIDVQMPNLDGVEVVKRVRQSEDGEYHLPVFAVTAYAMDEQRVSFLNAGFDDVLVKPIAPNVLADYLSRLWEKTATE